jgi:hypothetical protein
MLFSRHKPAWLYAALPALYLVAGLLVVASLRTALGLASGLLMIAAAIAIVAARGSHRRRAQEAELSRLSTIIAPPSRLAATTEFVRAIVPPKLGHRDIDRQHRSLASRAATLRVAFAHNDDASDMELLIHELVDFMEQHVDDEIEAMEGLGVRRHPDAIAADRQRIAEARHDAGDYSMGGITLEHLVERTAGRLVAGHLMTPHPALPSIDDALRQLRDTPT